MSGVLVHKETLGVVQWYWDGESYLVFDGKSRPKMERVTLKNHDLDPEEWWEVCDDTALARRIAIFYPFFDPVVVDDELVNIAPWPAWKRYGEEEPQPEPQIAVPVGRQGKYNRRRR